MAITEHIRVRYIDHIRTIIGDTDKVLFTDDELKSYFDKHSSSSKYDATVTAYDNRYRLSGCGCCGGPVWLLRIDDTSAPDGAVYIIDEAAGTIWFDEDDPDNTATAPTDGDTLDVTYWQMNTKDLVVELFFILSSNHAKLVSAQNIAGIDMDLTQLSNSFYNQAVRWAAQGDC